MKKVTKVIPREKQLWQALNCLLDSWRGAGLILNRNYYIIILFAVLFLVACGSQSNEISHLEEAILHSEAQRQSMIDTINEQTQDIQNLQGIIAELEKQYQAQSMIHDEILDSFVENLASVSEFLGLDDLFIADEDITRHGPFVTAYSDSFVGGGIRLIFHYHVLHGDIRWTLLEYTIGPIEGPGFIDGGHVIRQWQQEDLFDESFIMRFYSYDDVWPEPIGSYIEKEISPYSWQSQVKKHMQTHRDIRIINLWYEQSRLVVDITPASAVPFNVCNMGLNPSPSRRNL